MKKDICKKHTNVFFVVVMFVLLTAMLTGLMTGVLVSATVARADVSTQDVSSLADLKAAISNLSISKIVLSDSTDAGADGAYLLDEALNVNREVQIVAADGASPVLKVAGNFRHFVINNPSSTVTFDGLTLKGNTDYLESAAVVLGGGILASNGSTVVLKNCVIKNNAAYEGGGIEARASDIKMEYSRLESNTAVKDESLTGDDEEQADLDDLAKGLGGGAYLFESTLSAVYSVITDNVAEFNGAGIYTTADFDEAVLSVNLLNSSVDRNFVRTLRTQCKNPAYDDFEPEKEPEYLAKNRATGIYVAKEAVFNIIFSDVVLNFSAARENIYGIYLEERPTEGASYSYIFGSLLALNFFKDKTSSTRNIKNINWADLVTDEDKLVDEDNGKVISNNDDKFDPDLYSVILPDSASQDVFEKLVIRKSFFTDIVKNYYAIDEPSNRHNMRDIINLTEEKEPLFTEYGFLTIGSPVLVQRKYQNYAYNRIEESEVTSGTLAGQKIQALFAWALPSGSLNELKNMKDPGGNLRLYTKNTSQNQNSQPKYDIGAYEAADAYLICIDATPEGSTEAADPYVVGMGYSNVPYRIRFIPPVVYKEFHEVVGWKDSSTGDYYDVDKFFTIKNKTLVLVPQYGLKTYEIYCDLGNGVVLGPIYAKQGDTVALPEGAEGVEREGYEFLGWFFNKSASLPVTFGSFDEAWVEHYSIDSDYIMFYAGWRKIEVNTAKFTPGEIVGIVFGSLAAAAVLWYLIVLLLGVRNKNKTNAQVEALWDSLEARRHMVASKQAKEAENVAAVTEDVGSVEEYLKEEDETAIVLDEDDGFVSVINEDSAEDDSED